MILSHLQLQALNWNQWITDNVFQYRSLIYWDRETFKFEIESRRRHIWPLLFVNFGQLGATLLPCVTYYLISVKSLNSGSVIQVLAGVFQVCIALSCIVTLTSYLRWDDDLVYFFNHIVPMERSLENLSKLTIDKPPMAKSLKFISNPFNYLKLPSGELDWIGVFSN